MSFTPLVGAWETLYFTTDAAHQVYGGAYSGLDFWVNGGAQTEHLYIEISGPGTYLAYDPVNTPVNSWNHVFIPMSLLDPHKDPITGVMFRTVDGTPTNGFYVDNVRFAAGPYQ
jgi:hypothetical protein